MRTLKSKKKGDAPGDAKPRALVHLREVRGKGLSVKLLHALGSPLERVLSLRKLNALYASFDWEGQDLLQVLQQMLDVLSVRYNVVGGSVERIPKEGPVVVVANHPFGGIEGIILAHMVLSARPDAKILANYLLGRVEACRDAFIFVDPFDAAQSKAANLRPMRAAIRWLRAGGVVGVFPAGEVAHVNLRRREITDPVWSSTVGRLVQLTEAAVVPMHFEGTNSHLFHAVGMVHSRLRTAMLPRELINKHGRVINARVGTAIPFAHVRHYQSAEELTSFIRLRTFVFHKRHQRLRQRFYTWLQRVKEQRRNIEMVPVGEGVDPAVLEREIAALPLEARLVDNGNCEVYCAGADALPNVLRELGRLREITFRGSEEGTGTPCDLDRFDREYLHLFIWNREKREIAGAYRLGQADVLLNRHGLKGLYTRTLFKYQRRLLNQINPALEMGRSFVRPEYQRSFTSLLLLWRGIGEFVVRNPRYKALFGPVSINREYQSLSKQLMVSFIRLNNFEDALSQCVRPRKPFKMPYPRGYDLTLTSSVIRDVDGISSLIAEIENDHKGIPVLLKQYIKLGGKILAFNRDPDFSDVLDGLIYVDLSKTKPRLLARYMGKEGTQSFLAYHRVEQ